MSQITGRLYTNCVAPIKYGIDSSIGVWQLEFDVSLLPIVQSLDGQQVVADGETISVDGFGGVFQVSAIKTKPLNQASIS